MTTTVITGGSLIGAAFISGAVLRWAAWPAVLAYELGRTAEKIRTLQAARRLQ